MTLPEFNDKYCLMCGSQRCGGMYDVVWREGCKHFKREILGEQPPNKELYEKILDEILLWEPTKLEAAMDFGLFTTKSWENLYKRQKKVIEGKEK